MAQDAGVFVATWNPCNQTLGLRNISLNSLKLLDCQGGPCVKELEISKGKCDPKTGHEYPAEE